MSKAPERIWIDTDEYECRWYGHGGEQLHGPYIRKDLHTAEIQRLQERVAELEGALRFYADVSDYARPFTGGMGKLWRDCGTIARAALEQEGGE